VFFGEGREREWGKYAAAELLLAYEERLLILGT
jgi:hypothetical protein